MDCKLFTVSLVLVSLLLTYFLYWNVRPELKATWTAYIRLQPPSQPPDQNMKTILLWTPWFQMESWYINQMGFSWEENKHSDLRDFGCDQDSYKCTITSNRSHLEDERLYDGFLFHQVDINQQDIPDQSRRGANQVYMFNTLESPIHSMKFAPNSLNYDPIINNNFFNVTMTYSTESEVHIPQGKVVKVASHPVGAELDEFITSFGELNARHVTTKKFSAVIMVSNCASLSDREKVLGDLGRVVPVDVFGACGTPAPSGRFDGTPEGHKLLAQTYPFYLSFENSLCDDYVSEKFYNILGSDMIPVVMNGANMSRIAPKHSYIDLKDFATIRELGYYLQKVSSDPALYASYFWWRQYYEVQRFFGRNGLKIFCEACRYLHSGKGPTVIEDFKKEWVDGKCRGPPIITYLDEE